MFEGTWRRFARSASTAPRQKGRVHKTMRCTLPLA